MKAIFRLEGFLVRISMDMFNQDLESQLIEFSEKNNKQESCGLIVSAGENLKFIACDNINPNPKYMFTIDPVCFLDRDVRYVFHSHVIGTEKPSELDIKNCKIVDIPYIIYSLKTKKFFLLEM